MAVQKDVSMGARAEDEAVRGHGWAIGAGAVISFVLTAVGVGIVLAAGGRVSSGLEFFLALAMAAVAGLVLWGVAFLVAGISWIRRWRRGLNAWGAVVALVLSVGAPAWFSVQWFWWPTQVKFVRAITQGDEGMFRRSLMVGLPLDVPEEYVMGFGGRHVGETPLTCAVRVRRTGMVKELLDRGAGVNVRDGEGQLPLSVAVENGDLGMVEMLLGRGADARGMNFEWGGNSMVPGATALHLAAWRGRVEIARRLLAAGADVNAKWGGRRGTPLEHVLAPRASGDPQVPANELREMVRLLVSAGADLHGVDASGSTPAISALASGDMELAGLLVSKNGSSDVDRLISAVVHEDEASALAIARRIDRVQVDPLGRALLRAAVKQGMVELAKFLLSKEVLPGAGLQGAVEAGDARMVELLVTGERGATWIDVMGYAARLGKVEMVKLAVGRGVDVGVPLDNYGRGRVTPLYAAAEAGRLKVVEFLLGQGADVNAGIVDDAIPVDRRATPLDGALLYRHIEVARVLIAHGGVGHRWEGDRRLLESIGVVTEEEYKGVFGGAK